MRTTILSTGLVALLSSVASVAAQEPACTIETVETCLGTDPDLGVSLLQADIRKTGSTGSMRTLADHLDGRGTPEASAKAMTIREIASGRGDVWASRDLAVSLLADGRSRADNEKGLGILRAVVDTNDDTRRWISKALADALTRIDPDANADEIDAATLQAARHGNGWASASLARSDLRTLREDRLDELRVLLTSAIDEDDEFSSYGRRTLASVLVRQGDEASARTLLTEVASGTDEHATQASIDLAEIEAVSGDLSSLRDIASRDEPRAMLALARILEAGTPSERLEAADLFAGAATLDPSSAPSSFHVAAGILLENGMTDRAVELYALASDAGNSWSSSRLSSLYRWGTVVPRSAERSAAYADRALEQGNSKAALPALMNLYDTGSEIDVEDIVRLIRDNPQDLTVEEMAEGISWSSLNARVKLAQYAWRESGRYDGPIDGVMNSRTFSVFGGVCREEAIAACRDGIMPEDLMVSVVSQIVAGAEPSDEVPTDGSSS